MIRLLVWLLLFYIGYRIVVYLFSDKKNEVVAEQSPVQDATTTYRDPVCGVYVSEEDAVVGRLDGQRHYFCSRDCLEKFREQLDHNPQ